MNLCFYRIFLGFQKIHTNTVNLFFTKKVKKVHFYTFTVVFLYIYHKTDNIRMP
jgi:hypothetical protein